MSPRVLSVAACLVALLAPTAASAATDPAALKALDKASSCHRARKAECTLEHADKALAALTPDDPQRLRREAAMLRAEALALLDRADDAAKAFDALLVVWPEYQPADPDARVRTAWEAARTRAIQSRLPGDLGPGEVPTAPLPDASELTPDPWLYAPERLANMDVESATRKSFRLRLGGGVAILAGESADRYDSGPVAVVGIGYAIDDRWGLFLQAHISIHSFADGFVVEPGYGRGLTTFAATFGGSFTHPIIEDLDFFVGVGFGGGFFGVREAFQEKGVVLQGFTGLRYWLSEILAVRIDGGPTAFFPIGGKVETALHGTIQAHLEVRF